MISERVRQVVTEEIETHKAAITHLEQVLAGEAEVATEAPKGKGPQLTDAQKAKQRRKVREYWKKKKLEKLAATPEPVAEAADAEAGVPLLAAAK